MDKNCSLDSLHNGAGWQRLSIKVATELRPQGNMEGKGLAGRGHSLGLLRQRGKWGAGHWRDHRELVEAGGSAEREKKKKKKHCKGGKIL